MGRDPNSPWLHWLAHSRRDDPGSRCGTLPPGCSPSSPCKSPSATSDHKPIRSRSSATSYFALLSANEEDSHDARLFANHKQHGHPSGLTTRNMDSTWAAWGTGRGHQRQLAAMSETASQEKAQSSERSSLTAAEALSPTDSQQLRMQNNGGLVQDRGYVVASYNAATTTSAVPSPADGTSPLPSPLNNLLDFDIDSLGTDFLSDFCSASPFDPTNPQAGPGVTAGFDDGDFTGLEEQYGFPLDISDGPGKSSASSKRNREEHPGQYVNDGQIHLGTIPNKKQRTVFPWTDPLDT